MNKSDLSNLMTEISINRDEIAFSNLFDFIAPKINAYYLQNGLLRETAEELTQEVMSAIWSKSHLYNSDKSAVSTWIFSIARNKKVDFLRKNSKINYNEEDIREFLYQENSLEDVRAKDIGEQIRKINGELDLDQQKIIKMNFFENKSHKKIAEELEIPLGTVKSRIRHILIKMQRLL